MRVCVVTTADERTNARVIGRSELIRTFMPPCLCKINTARFAYGRVGGTHLFARLQHRGEMTMAEATITRPDTAITRQQLIDLLNQDLSREYQAIIAYVV